MFVLSNDQTFLIPNSENKQRLYEKPKKYKLFFSCVAYKTYDIEQTQHSRVQVTENCYLLTKDWLTHTHVFWLQWIAYLKAAVSVQKRWREVKPKTAFF